MCVCLVSIPGQCVASGMKNGHGDEIDFEKYSVSALGPILETVGQRLDLESSVDPSLLLDPSLERERQAHTRKSWFRKTSPGVAANEGEEESASDEGSDADDDDEKTHTLTEPLSSEGDLAPAGYSKVEILIPDTPTGEPTRSFSPIYSTPVTVTGGGLKSCKATAASPDSKRQQQNAATNSNGEKLPPMPTKKKPLPPTPPKKPQGLLSSTDSTGTGEEDDDNDDGERKTLQTTSFQHKEGDGGGWSGKEGGGEERESEGSYANFMVLKRGERERERSVSNPWPLKKPMPLPRNGKAGTLDRLDLKNRDLELSLPPNFKPSPSPRKPTLISSPSSSSSPKTSRSPTSQKPPISTKPLLPKASPPLTRAHPHTPSPPTKHRSPVPPSPTEATDVLDKREEEKEENSNNRRTSPVAPPRRRRKAKTSPTRRKALSPIYSPTHGSPVKTVAVPSDAGSSDLPDTSSESDHSHPHHKFLPSPSPVPRSPSPFGESSPVEWQEGGSQDSSLVAQRNSIPSIHSSIPPSPFDATSSTYGYVGDRDPLPPVSSPYSTITRPSPGHTGLSPLPTSSE